MVIAFFGKFIHSFLVYGAMGLFFPETGFNVFTTFSDFTTLSSLFTSILTAVIVAIVYRVVNGATFANLSSSSKPPVNCGLGILPRLFLH